MAKVILTRSSEYINRARKLGVYIDDEKVGLIKNGGVEEYEVEPGMHTIYTKVDWCASPKRTFYINGNETIDFSVAGFKYASWMYGLSLAVLAVHLFLTYTAHIYYVGLILIIPGLVSLYYISFGRNRYLQLTQETQ